MNYTFLEFFAGGGMARAGLGPNWKCLFANDFDHKKSKVYNANWEGTILKTADISSIKEDDLPYNADLAWASFPCQDLSLAGGGAGLKGARSGTFWPFWKLMTALMQKAKAPRVIAIENVCGTLTSHGGTDFQAISAAYASANYRFGAVVIDAKYFVPQSRPRLFVIGVRSDVQLNSCLFSSGPSTLWHTKSLYNAKCKLDSAISNLWVWWHMKPPEITPPRLADIVEDDPEGVRWHTQEQTAALLAMMSEVNKLKVEEAQAEGRIKVGGVYKRTRPCGDGRRAQRAEVRFDDLAGCLRTPSGGSSRQTLLIIKGREVRSRLISPRETARLMGLPDSYRLPANYNEAYHLMGDGVVVPAVRHLAQHLLEPLVQAVPEEMAAAA